MNLSQNIKTNFLNNVSKYTFLTIQVAALVLLALAVIASAGVLVPQAYQEASSFSYNVPTAAVGNAAAPVAAYGYGVDYATGPAMFHIDKFQAYTIYNTQQKK